MKWRWTGGWWWWTSWTIRLLILSLKKKIFKKIFTGYIHLNSELYCVLTKFQDNIWALLSDGLCITTYWWWWWGILVGGWRGFVFPVPNWHWFTWYSVVHINAQRTYQNKDNVLINMAISYHLAFCLQWWMDEWKSYLKKQ